MNAEELRSNGRRLETYDHESDEGEAGNVSMELYRGSDGKLYRLILHAGENTPWSMEIDTVEEVSDRDTWKEF